MFTLFKKLAVGLVFAFISVTPFTAHAVVIGFEGVAPDNDSTGDNVTPYTEGGFTLTSNGSAAVYHNDIFGANSGFNTNGSSIFGWCGGGPVCDGAPYTFTLTGPSHFNLVSIDFSSLDVLENPLPQDLPSSIEVTGFFFGGGSVVQAVAPTEFWNTFSFNGFTDLVAVQIKSLDVGGDPAMDNIVLTTVPEPDSIALMLLGVVGLIATRRRAA